MSVQGYWADLPSPAFAELPTETVAVLPLGATRRFLVDPSAVERRSSFSARSPSDPGT